MSTGASKPLPMIADREIETRAKDVLRAHGLYRVPIDPVVLAHKLGISLRNAKFSDESLVGMIAQRSGSSMILVNQSDSPNRKRFTIAHELGHHFLHLQGEDGEFVDGEADLFRETPGTVETTDKAMMEVQANKFAASLLMPSELVRQEWDKLRSVERIARHFNVSEEAMGYRLNRLGLL